MIRIAIFDDNAQRRDSLEALMLLDSKIQFVGSFPDCSQVLENIEATQPNIVLMDIGMPNVDGIAGVGLIKRNHPEIKVIMQTVFEDDEKIFACLQAGADGYILKNTSADKILQSINDVLNGGAFLSPSVALRVMRHFDQSKAPEDFAITTREHEVLTLLSKGNSHKMIADQLGISYFTVNTHVKKIYEKLQVHSVTEAIMTAKKNRLI